MKHLMQTALIYTLFTLSAGQPTAIAENSAPDGEQDRLRQLHQRFQTGLDLICTKYNLPGMTAAYALPNGQVVAFASGLADKESGAKMTINTRMPAGSIGKTFVAATALGLAQDGILSLDDKVEKWLGNEPWFRELPNAHEITVRHLLMHRSGLTDHLNDPAWGFAAQQMVKSLDTDPDYYFKPAELIKFILNRPPLFPTGQDFKYTDTGYLSRTRPRACRPGSILRSSSEAILGAFETHTHRTVRPSRPSQHRIRLRVSE